MSWSAPTRTAPSCASRDVGRVELGARTTDSFGRFNGGPGALIAIFQAPGANALPTAEGVAGGHAAHAGRSFPEGVAYKTTYDTTAFVQREHRSR